MGAPMAITTVDSLRRHLQWAIELEHATLPPYLCALYSIKEGHNEEAAEVVHSVFMEEMLHLTIAANILNAVGGSPVLDYAEPASDASRPTCRTATARSRFRSRSSRRRRSRSS